MWAIGHNQFPRIYIGNRKCKDNLLKFLHKDEITEAIMRGQDSLKRKFLIVKYLIKNKVFIDIYLQNSPLWENNWIVCGNITDNLFPNLSKLTDKQIAIIESIIRGRLVKLSRQHEPYNKLFDGEYIRLDYH